jgi:RNA polymerase sigma factor (sigma-70 family)
MASGSLNEVIHGIRRLALLQDGGPTDGQLLECFLAWRDEGAFAALVRRHGSMVLGVCRRVLGGGADAEDAFQVAFLVLARKAAAVVPREAVGNFLYGVAYRTALKARAARVRRQRREKQVKDMPHPPAESDARDPWPELRAILDEELQRLPELYRLPVVLCDLEGRARKEVARQLDIPEGTLSSRLAAARKRLAHALRRRGLTATGGALAAALAGSASARVPAALVGSTVKTATLLAAGRAAALSPRLAALMEGVLRVMSMTKPKLALLALLLAAAATFGANLLRYQAAAQDRPEKAAERPKETKPKEAAEPARLTPAQYVESQDWALTGVDAENRTLSAKLFRWIGEYAGGNKALEVLEPDRRPLGIWKLNDYPVDKDAKVVIDGKPGELKELKPEMRVTLRLVPGKAAVARIDATSPEDAVLKAADVEKNTITVATGGKETMLTLSPKAKLTRNGYASFEFTDLKPGMRLDLQIGVEEGKIVVVALKAGY